MSQLKSTTISQLLNLFDGAKSQYDSAYEEVNKHDKLTQDLLHKLELNDGDKNKIATQLKRCRRDRRYYRDIVEEYEDILKWIEDNQKSYNKLKELLSKVRKVESYHQDRTYIPRVLKE